MAQKFEYQRNINPGGVHFGNIRHAVHPLFTATILMDKYIRSGVCTF